MTADRNSAQDNGGGSGVPIGADDTHGVDEAPGVDQTSRNGEPNAAGMSRRGFLKTVGLGTAAVAAVAGAPAAAAEPAAEITPEEMAKITLLVNDRQHRLLVEPRWSLLFVLREKLGLSAAKEGCARGECGACTVLIDEKPRYACLTLAVEAAGHRITTLEGLMQGEELGDVQQAFAEHDGLQCGYCTPGQIVAAEGLLRANTAVTLDEIRTGLSGNLCRCGAYPNIFRAVEHAAQRRQTGGKS